MMNRGSCCHGYVARDPAEAGDHFTLFGARLCSLRTPVLAR